MINCTPPNFNYDLITKTPLFWNNHPNQLLCPLQRKAFLKGPNVMHFFYHLIDAHIHIWSFHWEIIYTSSSWLINSMFLNHDDKSSPTAFLKGEILQFLTFPFSIFGSSSKIMSGCCHSTSENLFHILLYIRLAVLAWLWFSSLNSFSCIALLRMIMFINPI